MKAVDKSTHFSDSNFNPGAQDLNVASHCERPPSGISSCMVKPLTSLFVITYSSSRRIQLLNKSLNQMDSDTWQSPEILSRRSRKLFSEHHREEDYSYPVTLSRRKIELSGLRQELSTALWAVISEVLDTLYRSKKTSPRVPPLVLTMVHFGRCWQFWPWLRERIRQIKARLRWRKLHTA